MVRKLECSIAGGTLWNSGFWLVWRYGDMALHSIGVLLYLVLFGHDEMFYVLNDEISLLTQILEAVP